MKANEYRSVSDIAADVKKALKKEFPRCKFSVRVEHHRSMYVVLQSAPFNPVEDWGTWGHDNYAQLNHYSLLDEYPDPNNPNRTNGIVLTLDGFKMLKRVAQIGLSENWDDSDSQTDYFSCNYYFNLHIGSFGKPFTVKA